MLNLSLSLSLSLSLHLIFSIKIKDGKNRHLLSSSRENGIYIDFGTGFKTMPPQTSIAVAAFGRVVLRVTGLVVVVVLGFYVPPTAKAIRRPV